MDNTASSGPLAPQPSNVPRPTVSVSLKPRMCIKRKDDCYVPLIATDELPSWIVLKGVPTTLRGLDVLQLGIMNCGDHPKPTNDCYEIELTQIPAEIHTCDTKEDYEEHSSSASLTSSGSTERAFMAPDRNIDESKARSVGTGSEKSDVEDIQAKIAEITAKSKDCVIPLRSHGTPGTLGKKRYCTYWIRTGNCNYMQEGCKYLHEIPPDEPTRLAIGIRTYPTWMLEDPTLPPLLPAPLPAKNEPKMWQQPTKTQELWRRDVTRKRQGEIAAPISYSGHPKTPALVPAPADTSIKSKIHSHRLQGENSPPAPYSVHQQQSASVPGSAVSPINTVNKAPGPLMQNLPAVQQRGLFTTPQPHFPSHAGSRARDTSAIEFGVFDSSDGNTSSHSLTPATRELSKRQGSANGLFNNATVVGISSPRHPPATQPPISRPKLGTKLSHASPVSPGSMTAPSSPTLPQARTSTNPNHSTPAHSSRTNHNDIAFSTNGSVGSTSQAYTPGTSGADTATSSRGNSPKSISNSQEGAPSTPVLHRRFFVADGESRFGTNPVEAGSVKSHPRPRKGGNGKSRSQGGKAGHSAKGENHGQDSLI